MSFQARPIDDDFEKGAPDNSSENEKPEQVIAD